MLEQHLVAITDDDGEPIIAEAQAFSAAPGEVEIIVDAAEQTTMPQEIEDCIEENIAVGVVARGIYAGNIEDNVVQGGLGTSRGGKLFLRCGSNLINSYELTIYYHDQLMRDRSTTFVTPQVFLDGEVMEVPLQETTDLVVEVTGGIDVSGGKFKLLIGYGHYPYLYNLPQKVALDAYLQIYFTETPESGLSRKD